MYMFNIINLHTFRSNGAQTHTHTSISLITLFMSQCEMMYYSEGDYLKLVG